MADYNVTYRDTGAEALSGVVIVFLILFFPIGVIVLIVRTISKVRREHIEGNQTKADTKRIKVDTSLLQSDELERYHTLYKKGIITLAEYNAKKNQILYNKKLNRRAIEHEQKILQS